MSAFVNFEIFRSRKDFATSHECARERFFARVNANVIDQLVFGFEWSAIAWAASPKASVRCALWSANMFHR